MTNMENSSTSASTKKIGITLSGGGVRASVFHLGVLARLADEKLLENVTMISTVSGGSLVTGMIYQANNNKWPDSLEFKTNCIPFVKACVTERNLQLNAFLRLIFWPFPIFWKGRASIFSAAMRRCWKIKSQLNEIPETPRWNINATAIESGKSWRFVPNNRMGDYLLNYVEKPEIRLSEALCCSAAVPFLIGPLKLRTNKYKWVKFDAAGTPGQAPTPVEPAFKKLHIWDGGAYDNLGIEPLVKFNSGLVYRKEMDFLVVSDAAMAITTKARKWYEAMRLIDVTMDQVRALRARSLYDHFKLVKNSGAYLKIGESVSTIHSNSQCTLPLAGITTAGLTGANIGHARDYPTTLWKMKEEDFTNLFKHGWEVANAALVCQCPDVFKNQHTPVWP